MKKKIYIAILLVMAAISIVSCNDLLRRKDIQGIVTAMQANRLKLSFDRMALCVPDNDTARTDTMDLPFRLVMYVDSTNCSPCLLNQMYQWNSLIDKTRAEGNRVAYVFVFEPKDEQIEDAHFSAESSGLKNHVYLDTAHIFRSDNRFIPKSSQYHVMLINKEDSILMVGNPNKNDYIKKLFLNIISKHN